MEPVNDKKPESSKNPSNIGEKPSSEIDSVKIKLAQKEVQLAENINLLQRVQADFENYIKRVEKDKLVLKNATSAKIIGKFLITLDDFQRAFEHLEKGCSKEEFLKGMTLLFAHFKKTLQEEGLREIHAKGFQLDPYKHEVMLQQDDAKHPEGYVLEELQKGYMLHEMVLRCSKVLVSKKASNPEQPAELAKKDAFETDGVKK